MKHYYENVPRLGNVAVSRHAQSQMLDAGISQEAFDRALLDPTQPDTPDGQDILWRRPSRAGTGRCSRAARPCSSPARPPETDPSPTYQASGDSLPRPVAPSP